MGFLSCDWPLLFKPRIYKTHQRHHTWHHSTISFLTFLLLSQRLVFWWSCTRKVQQDRVAAGNRVEAPQQISSRQSAELGAPSEASCTSPLPACRLACARPPGVGHAAATFSRGAATSPLLPPLPWPPPMFRLPVDARRRGTKNRDQWRRTSYQKRRRYGMCSPSLPMRWFEFSLFTLNFASLTSHDLSVSSLCGESCTELLSALTSMNGVKWSEPHTCADS